MTTTTATVVPTGTWNIDPAHSSVEFQVKHLGIATVKGHFNQFEGALEVGPDGIPTTARGSVKVETVDTREEQRDAHLRSPDFFDAERHPYVRFVSEAAALDGERLMVRGRLHARGTSMPLTIEATVRTVGDELEIEAVTDADHHCSA
jgi:polyisoprenoid-binding protein YceI